MAYQNVGTCRFYVNAYEWANAVGMSVMADGSEFNPILHTLPVNPIPFTDTGGLVDLQEYAPEIYTDDIIYPHFLAILGHDFTFNWNAEPEVVATNPGPVVNARPGDTGYQGFSLMKTVLPATRVYLEDGDSGNAGSIMIGTIYDMPNAPNLSLTMSRDYGSTKEFTTYNGSSMSNTMVSKPPKWGDLGAWELSNGDQSGAYLSNLSKSGRRSWDLKFSYMDDGDLWGSNQMLSFIREDISDGTDSDDYNSATKDFNFNLLTDNNFFSQVWHKTLGGTLPFIFQPNVTTQLEGCFVGNNPDQFAICRFKNSSLEATQSAFNVYDISVSIEEVW